MKMMADAVVTLDSKVVLPRAAEGGLAAAAAERSGQVRRLARLEQDGEDQDQANDDVQDDD